MSQLRAKCPECRGFTVVALGPEYVCHSCGREFAAGLVRVPRAWGEGGEPMAAAAFLPLPYPEAAVVEEDALGEQTRAVAAGLPARPPVLGGCCCAHVGAVERLASRHGRIGLIWLDAHGDLNTPETSPSGNEWGMPLRMLLDAGTVLPDDVALVGARNLDPPEAEFVAASGVRRGESGVARALDGTNGAYVAIDCDALDPSEITAFMPEPGGISLAHVERLLQDAGRRARLLGAGFSGLAPAPSNLAPLARLCAALGL